VVELDDAEVREAFRTYDADQNGAISWAIKS
jgi:Ca2+-binding EF-hand superfamily protein